MHKLTRREAGIAELISQGLDNRTIAKRAGLEEQSVKNLVSTILRKLECANRTQVALRVVNEWGGRVPAELMSGHRNDGREQIDGPVSIVALVLVLQADKTEETVARLFLLSADPDKVLPVRWQRYAEQVRKEMFTGDDSANQVRDTLARFRAYAELESDNFEEESVRLSQRQAELLHRTLRL